MGNLLTDDILSEDETQYVVDPKDYPEKAITRKEKFEILEHNEAVLDNIRYFIRTKQFKLKKVDIDDLKQRINNLPVDKNDHFYFFEVENKTIVFLPYNKPSGILSDLEKPYEPIVEVPITSFSTKVVKAFVMYEHSTDKYHIDALLYMYRNFNDEELKQVLSFFDFLGYDGRLSLKTAINHWIDNRNNPEIDHNLLYFGSHSTGQLMVARIVNNE